MGSYPVFYRSEFGLIGLWFWWRFWSCGVLGTLRSGRCALGRNGRQVLRLWKINQHSDKTYRWRGKRISTRAGSLVLTFNVLGGELRWKAGKCVKLRTYASLTLGVHDGSPSPTNTCEALVGIIIWNFQGGALREMLVGYGLEMG